MNETITASTKTKTTKPLPDYGMPKFEMPKFDLPNMEMPEVFREMTDKGVDHSANMLRRDYLVQSQRKERNLAS